MKEKTLIFIPYQDSDNYYSDGIMTREFAMLYLLWNLGYKKIINIKKPRTALDRKQYNINESFFPEGTIEKNVKSILDQSTTIQHLPIFNANQIIKKRGWWIDEFEKYIKFIEIDKNNDYLIYSDNPFAWKLIKYLYNEGCKVYFDIMDNFAIHPSLSKKEREFALNSYQNVFKYVDIVSANSQQTCDYMREFTNKRIYLIKNGVFADNIASNPLTIDAVKKIRNEKKTYKKCVGYIGKLGLRLDADLIDYISERCKDVLFVFVGGYLKGQINDKLLKLFENRSNVLHIHAVPSSYVYPILDEFDILSIPHAIGEKENGGDPLKLYQYLTRGKPIITTPILGVEEFKSIIEITNDPDKWVDFILNSCLEIRLNIEGIFWEDRIKPIKEEILKFQENEL